MKRILPPILLAGFLVLLALGASPAVQAQTPRPEYIPGPELVIYADSEPSSLRIPAPDFGPRRAAATIQVDFLGPASSCESFPAAAQSAYLYAASIWAGIVNSSVPIHISACWKNLGTTGILGSAGPYLVSGFSNQPQANTYYPYALADSLAHIDLDTSRYDIVSNFNSVYPNWYFGTGGTPPAGKYDFASVVLHEIGHGLGFSGSMDVSGGLGSYDTPPYIYDRFTENASGTALLSLENSSSALGSALTSGAYFDGPYANAANGGNRVQLYTPNPWRPGSSYSHLAESFNNTSNALMTYSLSPQEMVQNPGPVAVGILRDIGWSVTIAPPPTPPAAPSVLSATPASSSQINLTWSDNSSNEASFEIYRSLDASAWALVATPTQNTTAYSNSGLASGTRYFYRIRAANASGASDYSNSADAVTSGPPPAPSGLNAQPTSASQILLLWSDNSNIETGFEVQRSPDGSSGWATIDTAPANATGYANSGLASGTPYSYRIRALSANGASAYSNSATVVTLGPPPAPSNLSAGLTGAAQISLTWSDNSSSESGFELYRSTDNSTWTLITTAAINASSYANLGLAGGTRYFYRIRAVNGYGASDYSNSADAVTSGPPPAPSGLSAQGAGETQILLTWSDNSNIETGFEIQRSPDGSSGWETLASAPANATRYLNTGLTTATPYSYRVRAASVQGPSPDSNTAGATTWSIAYRLFEPIISR